MVRGGAARRWGPAGWVPTGGAPVQVGSRRVGSRAGGLPCGWAPMRVGYHADDGAPRVASGGHIEQHLDPVAL